MSDDVLTRMIGSFMATEQTQYAFGWQGGEPALMGLDFFRRVTELQEQHGRSGAVVANGLQTNGTLITDELAAHFARYNFLLGVSLDGPPRIHDHYRRYPDGRGSHGHVMRGIALLRKHKVDFNVLTLVNALNVREPRQIYRYLCDRGILFHQYIECVEFGEDGQLMPFAVSGEEWGDFLCAVYDEWVKADTRRVSVRLFDSILTMMVEGVANVCQMGEDCRQYYVVEHNGDIYPCDFFVQPELRLGNILNDSWEDVGKRQIYERFGARKRHWNPECRECEFLRFCAGDCPKNRSPNAQDPGRLSALCAGWKKFYAHSLDGFRRLADGIRQGQAHEEMRQRRQHYSLADRKVGRNTPCPCGSGKKYKNCCGK